MFKKFWASNWPKVLFAQILAVALVVGTFLVSVYGFQMTRDRVLGYILIAPALPSLIGIAIILKKPRHFVPFLDALAVAFFSTLIVMMMEPAIIVRGLDLPMAAIPISFAIVLSPPALSTLRSYKLSAGWARLTYGTECVVLLFTLTLL